MLDLFRAAAPGRALLAPLLTLLAVLGAAGPALALDTCPAGFVAVSPATFTMGALATDQDAFSDEKPVHAVEITQAFCVQETEVTQKQWFDVMGTRPWRSLPNPGDYTESDAVPVTGVSWHDAQDYIAEMNAADPSVTYRLPTEAEWELAARANDPGDFRTIYGHGDDPAGLPDHAWFRDNTVEANPSQAWPHPVKTKLPNAWGLFDMTGNVMEWCSDWYDNDYYGVSPARNPQGPAANAALTGKVVRGGAFTSLSNGNDPDCRLSNRFTLAPSANLVRDVGFRLVAVDRVPAKKTPASSGGGGGGGCFVGTAGSL